MAYLPMAVYGLEVPPGDLAVSARPDFPASFRLTMAAIDPSAEPEGEEGALARATLKIIRLPLSEDDFDVEDEEDFDPDEMDAILAGAEEDSDEDEEDDDDDEDDEEEVNGGPSDPAKSKKARKAAAEAAIKKLIDAEGKDVDEDGINGIDGVHKSAKARGKMAVTDLSEEDEEDSDSDDDMEGAEIEEFVICTLDPQKQYQQTLDITIGEDERVWFKVSGTHTIYLTGNYIEAASNPYDEDDEDESDDELDYDLEPDSDEELDALDELADPTSRVMEIDEEEEEEADEVPALVSSKKGKNKRAVEDMDISENLDDMIAKEVAGETKLSKKQQKKLKKNDGTAAAVNGKDDAAAATKSSKKVEFAKDIEQGPTPSKPVVANNTSSVTKVQGCTVDVRKKGSGPGAKKGDRVSMRYIGKLQSGKVFDSNKSGKPFSFKLGTGEVIKGWDVGVVGQTAGSEFRLTIPPHMGYGSKNMGDIPPNSTLVFDIKVLEIGKK